MEAVREVTRETGALLQRCNISLDLCLLKNFAYQRNARSLSRGERLLCQRRRRASFARASDTWNWVSQQRGTEQEKHSMLVD